MLVFRLIAEWHGPGYDWTEREAMIVIYGGYGTGMSLLLAYFLWEDGPCHWHRSIESRYLTFVLVLILTTTDLVTRHDRNHWGIIRDFTSSVLCMHIINQVEHLRMHPKFHHGLGAREATTSLIPAATPRSRCATHKLETALAEVLELKSGRHAFSMSDRTLPWVIFILNMLEILTEVTPVSAFARFTRWASFALNVMIGAPLILFVWRLFQTAPIIQEISRVVDGLVSCGVRGDLQYVLANISAASLIEVAEWHSVMQLTNTALNLDMLSVLSKAVLVDALQKSGIRSTRRQLAVRRLLLSCSREDLTMLKNLVDGSGTYHNLYKLVYHDISKASIRDEILTHFASEAHALRVEYGEGIGIKVLSDLDDTLYSSGGKFPAGCDQTFPDKVMYPGFSSLLRVLDRRQRIETPACNLVFLSARPHVYKDVSEDTSYQRFERFVQDGRMHTLPTLIAGNIWHGLRAVATFPFLGRGAWRSVGDLKFSKYVRFRALYLEYDFVFCGDNGQGDLWAGESMLCHRDEHESSMLAVLVHEVISGTKCLAHSPVTNRDLIWREDLQEQRIFFHCTYVGAALALHTHCPELVPVEQLAMVANAAVEEFESARLMYLEWGDSWHVAEGNLKSDLVKVNAVIQAAGLSPLREVISTADLLLTATQAVVSFGPHL